MKLLLAAFSWFFCSWNLRSIFRCGMFARELLDQFIKSASSWTCISSKYQLIKCVRSCSVLAQLRTSTTHKHRSWNVQAHDTYELVKCTNPSIDTKCTRWKVPISRKPCKNVHMHVQHTEKHVGVLQTADFFQVGQRIPRQIIWTYLSLSASTLKMTEQTLRTIQSKFYGQFKPNRETNIDKIMWPLPTFCGNKLIDAQLILGLFSRGLKSQQFSRMWTHGLRQFRQRFGHKKKDKRKG